MTTTSIAERALYAYLKGVCGFHCYRQAKGIIQNPQGHPMEIDITLSDFKIGIEVDGPYHTEKGTRAEYLADKTPWKKKKYKWKGYHKWKDDEAEKKGWYLVHLDWEKLECWRIYSMNEEEAIPNDSEAVLAFLEPFRRYYD